MITMHPGEYLKISYLEPKGKTQKELAEELGVSESAISRLLDGKSSVSTEMAIALEKVTGRSAESWLHLQGNFDVFSKKSQH